MINRDNYINIQGWMVTDLGLKGNELLIYAIIYGFTQDGEHKFKGSLNYLASWTNSTKQGMIKALKKLIEKNLIVKEEFWENNVKFCEYYVTKFNDTIKQSLMDGIKQSLTNNIDNNKLDNNIDNNQQQISTKKFIAPTLEEVEQYCRERNNGVDAKQFYDYYSVANWKDSSGKCIKNWKQKIIAVWEKKRTPQQTEEDRIRAKEIEYLKELDEKDKIERAKEMEEEKQKEAEFWRNLDE